MATYVEPLVALWDLDRLEKLQPISEKTCIISIRIHAIFAFLFTEGVCVMETYSYPSLACLIILVLPDNDQRETL